MAKKPTEVYTASGEIEAQQVKGFLEANGIPCFFQGEALRKTHGLTLDGLGRVEVHVLENDVKAATELLARAEAGELTLKEDEEQTPEGNVSLS